jgi:hypothetical protein
MSNIYDLDCLAHNWEKTCVSYVADSIDPVWGEIGLILRAMKTWSHQWTKRMLWHFNFISIEDRKWKLKEV